MKKILLFFSILVLSACSQKSSTNSVTKEKHDLCREAADTILAHMPGWKEIFAGYIDAPFHVAGQEFTKIELSVIAVNGKDTLAITTDEYQCYSKGNSINEDSVWVGEIGRVYPYEDNVAVIKRHNLLMRGLFMGVPGFTLEVHDNLIRAKFVDLSQQKHLNPKIWG